MTNSEASTAHSATDQSTDFAGISNLDHEHNATRQTNEEMTSLEDIEAETKSMTDFGSSTATPTPSDSGRSTPSPPMSTPSLAASTPCPIPTILLESPSPRSPSPQITQFPRRQAVPRSPPPQITQLPRRQLPRAFGRFASSTNQILAKGIGLYSPGVNSPRPNPPPLPAYRQVAKIQKDSPSQQRPEVKVLETDMLVHDSKVLWSACKTANYETLLSGPCSHLFCKPCHKASNKPTCCLCEVGLNSDKSKSSSSSANERSIRSSPPVDLTKMMITEAGQLAFKPEHQHEDLNYKAIDTCGAFSQSVREDEHKDPLDVYAEAQLKRIQAEASKHIALVRNNFSTYSKVASQTFTAIATPAKAGLKQMITVPGYLQVRLEQEDRAVKAEAELLRLRLAEIRLQAEEAALRAREHGASHGVQVLWTLFVLVCVLVVAWMMGFGDVVADYDGFAAWLDD